MKSLHTVLIVLCNLTLILLPACCFYVVNNYNDTIESKNVIVNLQQDLLNQNQSAAVNKAIFKHFWKSTGLSPPDPKEDIHKFLLSADEKFNLLLIGALPYNGIQQVRIHWLLYLISYDNNEYNFELLDELLDFMQVNSLRPGFELMGLPLNVKPETAKTNIYAFWYDVVVAIATHYIDCYGYQEIKTWRFELMNEPDLKQYNFLNFTLNEYLTYFKACTDALQAVANSNRNQQEPNLSTRSTTVVNKYKFNQMHHNVSGNSHVIKNTNKKSELKLGGPAGLYKRRDRHPLCWGLLDMCNSTWPPPRHCHLHYVSFHKKGGGSAGRILQEDLDLLDVFHRDYAFLRDVPIANDEADILTNWSLDEDWRGDVRYAALVAKVIIGHYKEIILKRNVQIEILSNDNGFMNFHPHYFTQRTLLTRFQMNNTTPKHVQFIKKPVYIAMGLLSLLGNEHLGVVQSETGNHSNWEAIATGRRSKHANAISILVVNVKDNATETENNYDQTQKNSSLNSSENITLTLSQFSVQNFGNMSKSIVAVYSLNNQQTNPYQLWMEHGNPVFPNKTLRNMMRQIEGPVITRLNQSNFIRNVNSFGFHLMQLTFPSTSTSNSFHLIHICIDAQLNAAPGRTTSLRGYFVTKDEILIVWSDKKIRSRCIKTYVIEYRLANGTFRRINNDDIVFLSYHHDRSIGNGSYRVRGIDYWDRPGGYSNVLNWDDIIHI